MVLARLHLVSEQPLGSEGVVKKILWVEACLLLRGFGHALDLISLTQQHQLAGLLDICKKSID